MKVKIEFEIDVPDVEFTDEELLEWIRFETGDSGSISMNNPLEAYEIEPIYGSLLWEEL